jgi:ABC-type multidrug transport system fused ATPase/permease subunit
MSREPKRPQPGEKPKKGTWGRLITYAKPFLPACVAAILCAAGGSALTLAGPSRLSDITDTITDGMKPDTDALEEIAEESAIQVQDNAASLADAISADVQTNLTAMAEQAAENLQGLDAASFRSLLTSGTLTEEESAALAQLLQDAADNPDALGEDFMALPDSLQDELLPGITVNDAAIDGSDQMDLLAALENGNAGTPDLSALPESVQEGLYAGISMNGVEISASDEKTAVDVLSDLNDDADQEELQSALSGLPDSCEAALFTDLAYEDTVISGADQQKMSEILADLDEDADEDTVLAALSDLPDSIYAIIEPHIDLARVVRIGVILVLLYLAGAALSALQGWLMAGVTQDLSKKMRSDIFDKINHLPMSYFHHHATGDTLSRVTNDVDLLSMQLNASVGTLVSAVTLFAGSLILMLVTNVQMTAAGVLASVLGFLLIILIMGRSQKYFEQQQSALGELDGRIEEVYSGHTVVVACSAQKKETKAFEDLNGKLRVSSGKAQALSGLMAPLMTFIGNFGYVAVCVVGAALTMNGKTTFGVIVSFMLYIRYFTQPLSQMAQAFQALQSAGAAAERVFGFLDEPEMEDESEKTARLPEKVQGNVSFRNVKFGYEAGKTIIHNFSADAGAGKKIAIVGPTGAGKSTLVNLLMRFYDVDSGSITIDGVDTMSVPRENVRSAFSMVLQDTWLFQGTVRENLVYNRADVSDEQIRHACRAVGLDHFIRTLPNGYDTVLDDSVSLSQGQKQQMTIARAMIADRPILILDEATSSIDTRTELQIQSAMDELMKGRTSFVIAHRLSTIRNADLILVLRDGDIVESGTHKSLMESNGFYAKLYNSQFDQQKEGGVAV